MTGSRTAIYCRLSQDRTGAGVVVERQERECRLLAQQLGWTVAQVQVDNDLSAYSGRHRPAYARLLAAIEAGAVDAVLAWHTDRLHRSPRELEDYISACELHNVVTHTVRAGPVDLSTPSGRAVARTLGAWARHESEHLSARTLAGKRDAATRGGYSGGPRPFGYRVVPLSERTEGGPALEIVSSEAEAVRVAAQAVIGGASLRATARQLNEQGIRTVQGKPFDGSSLRKILKRPTTAGMRALKGEVVGRGAWEPLLAEETWRGVCAILDDPARRTTVTYERRWLLSGLATCGVCGTPLTANTTAGGGPGKRHAAYRCRAATSGGSAHVTRDADALDEYVVKLVRGRLQRPDAAELVAVSTPDLSAVYAEADAIQVRLEEAARLYAEGAITAAQLTTMSSLLQQRLATAQGRLAQATRVDALAGLINVDVGQVWESLPLERRRAVVETLLEIVVLPRRARGRLPGGGYFDPDAVEVRWRGTDSDKQRRAD